MWEPGPFDKKTVGITCISMVVGGAGLVWFSCAFQNKKHGFSKLCAQLCVFLIRRERPLLLFDNLGTVFEL